MEIVIERATTIDDEEAIMRIRQQVFEREMGISVTYLSALENPNHLHLLARAGRKGDAVAALSVVDTSGNQALHESFGMAFDPDARVARYTQLAVLKPFRGINVPLAMMLEAHHSFVVPGRFEFTWLLFNAERAGQSLMSKWLAFVPGNLDFLSEYGRSRALVRDERAPRSEQAILEAEQEVAKSRDAFSASAASWRRRASSI